MTKIEGVPEPSQPEPSVDIKENKVSRDKIPPSNMTWTPPPIHLPKVKESEELWKAHIVGDPFHLPPHLPIPPIHVPEMTLEKSRLVLAETRDILKEQIHPAICQLAKNLEAEIKEAPTVEVVTKSLETLCKVTKGVTPTEEINDIVRSCLNSPTAQAVEDKRFAEELSRFVK